MAFSPTLLASIFHPPAPDSGRRTGNLLGVVLATEHNALEWTPSSSRDVYSADDVSLDNQERVHIARGAQPCVHINLDGSFLLGSNKANGGLRLQNRGHDQYYLLDHEHIKPRGIILPEPVLYGTAFEGCVAKRLDETPVCLGVTMLLRYDMLVAATAYFYFILTRSE